MSQRSLGELAVSASPRRLEALEALVLDVLEERLGPAAASGVREELRGRLAGLGEEALRGVNSPRRDLGTSWEDHRAQAYAELEHVGAVHLELGSFTAFPDERVRELVAGDGLSEFIRLDADPAYDPDVVADAMALPFRSDSLDRVGSNSTLEHIHRPADVLAETYRVLRPGGIAFVATPFVWPEHGYPDDHVRLTPGFYERTLQELGFVDIYVDRDGTAGLFNTLHNASKMAPVQAGRPETAAMRELHELVIALLAYLIPLDRFFSDASRQWFHSVRVIARKPGSYQPRERRRSNGAGMAERIADLLADPHTKEPLTLERGRLIAASTGTSYAVSRTGSVNFMEPRLRRPSPRDRARGAGLALRDRVKDARRTKT